jgi:hypothetical protein
MLAAATIGGPAQVSSGLLDLTRIGPAALRRHSLPGRDP